jgi:hypothetical protein
MLDVYYNYSYRSDGAQALFQARAMLWCHVKGRDAAGAAWWEERLRNIATAILSTHSR